MDKIIPEGQKSGTLILLKSTTADEQFSDGQVVDNDNPNPGYSIGDALRWETRDAQSITSLTVTSPPRSRNEICRFQQKNRVVANGCMSDEGDVLSGVPLGTVLVAILFVIMNSDIGKNIKNVY